MLGYTNAGLQTKGTEQLINPIYTLKSPLFPKITHSHLHSGPVNTSHHLFLAAFYLTCLLRYYALDFAHFISTWIVTARLDIPYFHTPGNLSSFITILGQNMLIYITSFISFGDNYSSLYYLMRLIFIIFFIFMYMYSYIDLKIFASNYFNEHYSTWSLCPFIFIYSALYRAPHTVPDYS